MAKREKPLRGFFRVVRMNMLGEKFREISPFRFHHNIHANPFCVPITSCNSSALHAF
jgi:hypothetical protein